MGTQIAKAVGYKVVKGRFGYRLMDPGGNFLTPPQLTEEDAWSFVPQLDTWENIGLVTRWLMQEHAQSIAHLLCSTGDEFPRALCQYALEACSHG
jgi:hypothetical protein